MSAQNCVLTGRAVAKFGAGHENVGARVARLV